jgi:DNA-binding transcriptional MerR regulator
MNPQSREMVVVMRPSELLSLEALARRAGMHPSLIERFVEIGLLSPCECKGASIFFESSDVVRLGTINRLRKSLGINLAGIAVVLDLIDHVAALRLENDRLRRR